MKTFKIPVKQVTKFNLPVTEAESEAEAVEVAKEAYLMGDYDMLDITEKTFINGEEYK